MATQVQTGNLQSIICASMAANPSKYGGMSSKATLDAPEEGPVSANSSAKAAAPQLFAHMVEFVALPGQTENLQTKIPLAIRHTNGESDGFSGCIVLFSEYEARLVTVITLWAEESRASQSNGNVNRLKRLLEPYVDRWMRARSFVTLVSAP
ncbi:MAG: hypothetical protein WAM58_18050 [Candidatus Acidiferrum sp.]